MKQCTECKEIKDEKEFYRRCEVKSELRAQCKTCLKKHRDTVRDRLNSQSRESYQRHKEHHSKRKKLFYRAHKDECNERGRHFNKKYYRELRFSVLEILGNVCVRCGFDDIRALQIDHINGGGSKERKQKGTTKFLKEVLEMKKSDVRKKFQLLCANCNSIKKHENDEFSTFGRRKAPDSYYGEMP